MKISRKKLRNLIENEYLLFINEGKSSKIPQIFLDLGLSEKYFAWLHALVANGKSSFHIDNALKLWNLFNMRGDVYNILELLENANIIELEGSSGYYRVNISI